MKKYLCPYCFNEVKIKNEKKSASFFKIPIFMHDEKNEEKIQNCPFCGNKIITDVNASGTKLIWIVGNGNRIKNKYLYQLLNEPNSRKFLQEMQVNIKMISEEKPELPEPFLLEMAIFNKKHVKYDKFILALLGENVESRMVDSEYMKFTNRCLANLSGVIYIPDFGQKESAKRFDIQEEEEAILDRLVRRIRAVQNIKDAQKISIPIAVAGSENDAAQDFRFMLQMNFKCYSFEAEIFQDEEEINLVLKSFLRICRCLEILKNN